MPRNCYRVTFHLDGSGIYFDPLEPIHLDALLAWHFAPLQDLRHLDRSVAPGDVRLPVVTSRINGHLVYHASALFPIGPTGESVWYWRKRFRTSRCELATGSPNITNGTYRDWQMPLPLLLCRRMVAYVRGPRREIRRALEGIRYLGKKRAHGHGKVLGFEIDQVDQDYSLVMDGRAMRWLPMPSGPRLTRPRPPYWHPMGRVECCEVGDEFNLPREDGYGSGKFFSLSVRRKEERSSRGRGRQPAGKPAADSDDDIPF